MLRNCLHYRLYYDDYFKLIISSRIAGQFHTQNMESSNKKNMALKLELWLAAKQSGGVTPVQSPLRPVIHTTSSHQRVPGFLTTFPTADGATKTLRKSFSRSTPTSGEDVQTMSSSSIRAASSPLRTLPTDGVLTPVSPKINQFTIFSEVDNDENSKENQPYRDQNITSNVIPPKVSKLCQSSITTKCFQLDQPNKGATVSGKTHRKSASKSLPESLDHTEFASGDYIPADHSVHYNENLSFELKHSKLFVKPSKISLNNWDNFEMKAKFLQEELQAMTVLNSILEQRVNELEQTISQDRLDANESASNRGKKHKSELKRLANERSSYEDRANQMVTQMGEQMALLQSMAMGRIEVT